VNGPDGIQTIPEGGKEQETEPIETPMKIMNRKMFLGWAGCRHGFIMTGPSGMIAIPKE
jgi:hypothetical protein